MKRTLLRTGVFVATIVSALAAVASLFSTSQARLSGSEIARALREYSEIIANGDLELGSPDEIHKIATDSARFISSVNRLLVPQEFEDQAFVTRVYNGVFWLDRHEVVELQSPRGQSMNFHYTGISNWGRIDGKINGRGRVNGYGKGEPQVVGAQEEACSITLLDTKDRAESAKFRFRCQGELQ